jgi:hypothetical protein
MRERRFLRPKDPSRALACLLAATAGRVRAAAIFVTTADGAVLAAFNRTHHEARALLETGGDAQGLQRIDCEEADVRIATFLAPADYDTDAAFRLKDAARGTRRLRAA